MHVANFRGKIAEMRENLVGSALLIPIIGQNRQCGGNAHDENIQRECWSSFRALWPWPRRQPCRSISAVPRTKSEKLDEAARQITLLASKGAHDAATSAARSLGGDQRNIDVLAQVADEAIQTMNEVITIEREVAAGDRDREAKLTAIRDKPRPPACAARPRTR